MSLILKSASLEPDKEEEEGDDASRELLLNKDHQASSNGQTSPNLPVHPRYRSRTTDAIDGRRATTKRDSDSASRQRSSTSTNAIDEIRFARKLSIAAGPPTTATATTTTTTQIMLNTSIFKPLPHQEHPKILTVVTEQPAVLTADGGDSGILGIGRTGADGAEESNYRYIASDRRANHIRSFTVNISPAKETFTAFAGDNLTAAHFRTSSSQFRYQPPRANNTREPKRRRSGSIGTILSAPWLHRQRPAGEKGKGFRVPRRWLSLRNVISFFNILILIVAIVVVSLVSYFAGVESTRSAIRAMSSVTMNDLSLKLDFMLGQAEDINIFSQTVFSSAEIPVGSSAKAIRQLYYLMQEFRETVDQIYVAAVDSTFSGVSVDRALQDTFNVKYYNRTTKPYRVVYQVDSSCSLNDTSCIMQAFDPNSTPVERSLYNVRQRPFFQQALSLQRRGWTSVYQYTNESGLTITAIQPVWIKRVFQYVCAVDITLNSLSGYLGEIAELLRTEGAAKAPLLLVVERRSASMVASSRLAEVPLVDPASGLRLLLNQTRSKEVRDFLQQIDGSLGNIVWPEDESPLMLGDSSSVYSVLGSYVRSESDIDWVIVAFFPLSSYNRKLTASHMLEVPLAALVVLLLAIVCSVTMTRAIGKPLKKIAEEMLHVADLDFESQSEDENEEKLLLTGDNHSIHDRLCMFPPRRWCFRSKQMSCEDLELKEIQNLRTAMDSMKSGLKSFAKYVPVDIVALLMKIKREAVLGVDEVELTLFFSDIVNFTAIAESIPPGQLVEIMSEYLSEVSDLISENHGIVDKFIGDSVMAFWNAPLQVTDHPSIACATALCIQKRLSELRRAWVARGLPELKTRIGIHTGLALVGNLGSSSRLNYTCLGDNVNLASRLEGLNKRYRTDIIISEATKNKLCPDMFLTRSLDTVAVKGKSRAVRVYELVGFKRDFTTETLSIYTIYERAYDEYARGNFYAAAEGFRIFLKAFGGDFVAETHLQSCSTPQENWNSIVRLDEK